MTVVAWYRRRRLTYEEQFHIGLRIKLDSILQSWASQRLWEKILVILMVFAILGAMGSLGYVITKPNVGERFTEFYILGPDGKVENYPRQIIQGESKSVIVGIINHEHQHTTYSVEIMIDGEKVGALGPIALRHEEKWEGELSLPLTRVDPRQKIEFLLYKGQDAEVYLKTHFWVDFAKEGQIP